MFYSKVYNLDLHSKLSETFKKIIHQLDVNNFGYLKVNSDCTYNYFSSDQKIAQLYIREVFDSNIFFNDFISIEHFNGSDYYFVSWPDVALNLSMQIYLDNDYWNGISVINYEGDSIQIWWVTGSRERKAAEKIYSNQLNRQKLLIAIDYFNKKYEIELDKKCSLYKYDSFNFLLPIEEKRKLELQLLQEKRSFVEAFYPNGVLVRSKNKIVKLTHKEIDILSYMADGMSAKEIAKNLGNQPKTIENQKEALKNKIDLYLKSDLIKLYNDQISCLFR
jgi:DNA-binding CsgD family transcriptional regulator